MVWGRVSLRTGGSTGDDAADLGSILAHKAGANVEGSSSVWPCLSRVDSRIFTVWGSPADRLYTGRWPICGRRLWTLVSGSRGNCPSPGSQSEYPELLDLSLIRAGIGEVRDCLLVPGDRGSAR